MSTVKIAEFKYLVIATGYTGRLIDKIQKIKNKIEGEDLEEVELLYIYDELYGNGLTMVADKEDNGAKELMSLIDNKKYCGIITFKCERLNHAFSIAKILKKLNYCACFSFGNLYEMELLNKKVLVMNFDCESG